jgi:hypothetical protein
VISWQSAAFCVGCHVKAVNKRVMIEFNPKVRSHFPTAVANVAKEPIASHLTEIPAKHKHAVSNRPKFACTSLPFCFILKQLLSFAALSYHCPYLSCIPAIMTKTLKLAYLWSPFLDACS